VEELSLELSEMSVKQHDVHCQQGSGLGDMEFSREHGAKNIYCRFIRKWIFDLLFIYILNFN
jgi:hypothetical protein